MGWGVMGQNRMKWKEVWSQQRPLLSTNRGKTLPKGDIYKNVYYSKQPKCPS